ncbi:hypothetical protein [Nostoc sp. CALU 1950]|uniref:hypothetical protein n=1 Tax=Nostoc sp. CALU 1950 TaxID=3104321 RepID=UPI003EBC4025
MRKVSLEDDEFYITVWKDGTFRVLAQLDAIYYENDPNFLINIPLNEIPQLLQKV